MMSPHREKNELERLATLFSGLSNRTRLAVLLGVDDEQSMTAVAEDLGIRRPSVQGQLENLVDTGLVYRPDDRDYPYALTPLGEYFVEFLDQKGDLLLNASDRVNNAEITAREEFADVPLSDDGLEREVARRK